MLRYRGCAKRFRLTVQVGLRVMNYFFAVVVQVLVNQQAFVVVRQNDVPSVDIAMKNSAIEEGAVVRC